MSDQLSAAAGALGLPEDLVQRSAAARAAASGSTVDDLLSEWAGGEAAPRSEPAAEVETPAPTEVTPDAEASPEPAAPPEIVVDLPEPPSAPEPVPAGPYKAPVLVGTSDNPMAILAGVIGLFFIVVMVGLVGPSIPVDDPGARSSDIAYSDAAVDGRHLYLTTGCASCHTQMVRPVIADVGLGPVTLNDTDQVLGTRRFGPDLSDVGSRLTEAQIGAIVGGLGSHPSQSLSSDDFDALVAYMVESKTSPPAEEGS